VWSGFFSATAGFSPSAHCALCSNQTLEEGTAMKKRDLVEIPSPTGKGPDGRRHFIPTKKTR
jgi:hypothetical protein